MMLFCDSSRCNNTAAWGAGTTKRSPLSLLTSFLHLSLSIRVDKQEARTADVSFLHFSHAQTQIQKPWLTKETTSCLDAERFWRNRHHHIQKLNPELMVCLFPLVVTTKVLSVLQLRSRSTARHLRHHPLSVTKPPLHFLLCSTCA